MQPANNGVCKVPKGGKREEEGRRRERGEKLTRPGESGRTRRRKGKMAKWHLDHAREEGEKDAD